MQLPDAVRLAAREAAHQVGPAHAYIDAVVDEVFRAIEDHPDMASSARLLTPEQEEEYERAWVAQFEKESTQTGEVRHNVFEQNE